MKAIQDISIKTAHAIRWVLTDIDDTLTKDGKLLPDAYTALWKLKNAGLSVIAVTGRAATWGYLLTHEWPVDGVITENGAIAYYINKGHHIQSLAFPNASLNTCKPLQKALSRIKQELPHAQEAQDNHLRMYDIAIDHAENVSPHLCQKDIERIIQIFKEEGCYAQASSIHINAWHGEFNKKESSLLFLQTLKNYNDMYDRDKVLYVGDALNDESMFCWFKNSCAVANIQRWINQMKNLPTWISKQEYGHGFAEIVDVILTKRNLPIS